MRLPAGVVFEKAHPPRFPWLAERRPIVAGRPWASPKRAGLRWRGRGGAPPHC